MGHSPFNLVTPIPNQTLVWLRIALGLLGGGDILGNGIYYHWYKRAFDGFTFRYYGFEWVRPLPEPFFSLFFIAGFLLGIAVALGWRFRITAPLFALSFTYVFLLEKAHYLNHAYLFCWLAWLLVFTPAWREWSLDVRRNPADWSPVAPRWSVAIFPLLMGIVYFFGGIAKLNYDWLMEAMPLHLWVKNRSEIPLIGPVFALKPTAYFMAWGGFLLDLLIAFFLLHKRLRWWALAAAVFFHATNHLIFNIGIFPYLSLVMTSLFFEPHWPGKLVDWLAKRLSFVRRWQSGWQMRMAHRNKPCYFEVSETESFTKQQVLSYSGHTPFFGTTGLISQPSLRAQPRLVMALTLLIAVHVLLPLRHHYFKSDVAWSEEGHRYSWRMMLRSKRGYGGLRVVDNTTGQEEYVDPKNTLNDKQARKMYTHPDMILQYAHYLGEQCGECAVYADITIRLNNGNYTRFIDPTVDLTQQSWGWLETKSWVLPEGK